MDANGMGGREEKEKMEQENGEKGRQTGEGIGKRRGKKRKTVQGRRQLSPLGGAYSK